VRRDSVKDQGFLVGAQLGKLGKGLAQCLEQGFALGVVANVGGELLKGAQLGQFVSHAGALAGQAFFRLGPLFLDFVEGFKVVIQHVGEFFGRRLGQAVLQALGHGAQGATDGVAAGREQLPQHQRDELALA
jgi:hypothetical protein